MDEIVIKRIQIEDISDLNSFVENLGSSEKSFRYFKTRPLTIIGNHLCTLLAYKENIPVGYGHLDKEADNIWLGIAVSPTYQGRGLGKLIMSELLRIAQMENVKFIKLTVDHSNSVAWQMYEKLGFQQIGSDKVKRMYKYRVQSG